MNSSSLDGFVDMSGGEEDDQMMMMMNDDLRRGPWTVDEDFALINYIALHGEGRWNALARSAGLKRTGKSCRLRWLNYLRPDVRRGNITLEEQLLILELHSRWGNRWSKIAQHLPGRTDNEIKNYWRTRVQKHAKQLKCDVNSKRFKDTMRYLWMPRLAERIDQAALATTTTAVDSSTLRSTTTATTTTTTYEQNHVSMHNNGITTQLIMPSSCSGYGKDQNNPSYAQESLGKSEDSLMSNLTDCYYYPTSQSQNQDFFETNNLTCDGFDGSLISPSYYFSQAKDFESTVEQNNSWFGSNDSDYSDNLWNVEDILFLQQFSN